MSLNEHGNYHNSGMDPHDGLSDVTRKSNREIELQMYEEQYTHQELSPSPDIDNPPDATARASGPIGLLDQERNLHLIWHEPARCVHIALPDHFLGKKRDF
jgi:hypothetical protein